MIEVLLAGSIILNILLIWYIIQLVKRFLNISDELENLFVLLEEYSEHVDIVYNLERFYGDTTLENLLRHSKAISGVVGDFRAIYDVNYTPEEEDKEENE
jgi:hypothetical protein